jgi:hypothetical protein
MARRPAFAPAKLAGLKARQQPSTLTKNKKNHVIFEKKLRKRAEKTTALEKKTVG